MPELIDILREQPTDGQYIWLYEDAGFDPILCRYTCRKKLVKLGYCHNSGYAKSMNTGHLYQVYLQPHRTSDFRYWLPVVEPMQSVPIVISLGLKNADSCSNCGTTSKEVFSVDGANSWFCSDDCFDDFHPNE